MVENSWKQQYCDTDWPFCLKSLIPLEYSAYIKKNVLWWNGGGGEFITEKIWGKLHKSNKWLLALEDYVKTFHINNESK